MQRLFQLAAWSIAIVTVILSVVPASYRPTTAVSHGLEHVLFF